MQSFFFLKEQVLNCQEKHVEDCRSPRGGEFWINHNIACIMYTQWCVQLF